MTKGKRLINVKLHYFIGEKSQFSMKHRILNIILIFGLLTSFWSAMIGYLLVLNNYSIFSCVGIGICLSAIYYLSFVKKKYNMCIFLSLFLATIAIPFLWLLNGGTAGSTPFYMMLFSPMGVVLLDGYRKFILTAILTIIALVMVIVEYTYPYLVTSYPTSTLKYVDVSIALITSIIVNSLFFTAILRHYEEEHQLAKKYLLESEETRKHLHYLSFHDTLTGLYNRNFFEIELLRIEESKESGIAVYVVDIDGLKFINDTLGHVEGDYMLVRAAQNLRSSFPDKAQIFRTGGDEYIVLLREVCSEELENYYRGIHGTVQKNNAKVKVKLIPLQMSIGYAYSADWSIPIRELLLEAENKMYREKLFHHANNNKSMIQMITEMLSARDYTTGDHSDRLQNIMVEFSKKCSIPESSMSDIQLFARFHDIGKIGIPDQILLKPGSLTDDERYEMRKHCEIGYRIACTATELAPIADWVLRHHEWWNGEGYPMKLKGTEIPLECRLLAIADSYDAMTSDRPYRKAMSHAAAIEELRRYSGIQFDPNLVESFISIGFIKLNAEMV